MRRSFFAEILWEKNIRRRLGVRSRVSSESLSGTVIDSSSSLLVMRSITSVSTGDSDERLFSKNEAGGRNWELSTWVWGCFWGSSTLGGALGGGS